MSLFLLLTALWRTLSPGVMASAELGLSGSPVFFSFQALSPGNGVMPSLLESQAGTECECRAGCLSNFTCLGYGYSLASGTCRLVDVHPTSEQLEASAEAWQWYARGGRRRLGEPCTADSECSTPTPGAACRAGVCSCRAPFQLSGDRCAKTGRLIEVGTGRFSSEPFLEATATNVDECKALCADNITCMACDFSVSDGRCLLYDEGITSDEGSGGDELSFVWRFPTPDGAAPDASRMVNGFHTFLLPASNGLDAAASCSAHNAILFPDVTAERLAELKTIWPEFFEPDVDIYAGVEDMLVEGTYVSTDGNTATTIAWHDREPNNAGDGGEDCAVILGTGLNDVDCLRPFQLLCQYAGDNLALGKLSWMNMALLSGQAANGNDGDASTVVASPPISEATLTWTVDLGSPVQVTGVLYVAGAAAADNRNTEVRVGSDPAAFDGRSSARCVLLERPFVAQGYARLFRCTEPLTGRYVRLIRRGPNPVLNFAELAVFGNRLEVP